MNRFRLRFRQLSVVHYVRRGPAGPQFPYDEAHRFGNMFEKHLVPFAQVVESGLTFRGHGKPVLRALPVAGKKEPAFPAESRKAVF